MALRALLLSCAATLVLAGALGTPAAAQTVNLGRIQYEQLPTLTLEGRVGGSWSGLFDYEQIMNPELDLENPTFDARNWGEIADAVLLPPPSDAPSPDAPTRVLLIARRYDTGNGQNPGGDVPAKTFIWERANPATLITLGVDPNLTDGSKELFCGGHALTKGGNVLWAGGTDDVQQITWGVFWGHRYVHLFMNKVEPYWVYESWGERPDPPPVPMMQRDRWYPTVMRLGDGSFIVAGHGYAPVTVPATERTRERCDVDDLAGTVTWRSYDGFTLLYNLMGGCVTGNMVDLQTYPRMHQLITGDVLSTLSNSQILSFDACDDPDNPDRWTNITGALRPSPDANTVHYVDLTPPTGPTETIYSMGGAAEGTHFLGASNKVLRMDIDTANPTASAWTNVGVPQLNAGRIYVHTVILLDGSMVAFGGGTQDASSHVETYFRHPERYAPPGVFAAPDSAWSYLNPQADERSYHSVALLLPSGEVLSAGGQGTSAFVDEPDEDLFPVPPWYTAELYKPAYMHKAGRPEITTLPESMAFGAQALELDVKLHSASSAGETRVALIGPASVTHAMDSGQIYIKLKFAPFTPNANPNHPTTIHFDAPPDGNAAPPGWYMLTVVNAEGLPAVAKWVRVGVP